jgi:hypothetical protein
MKKFLILLIILCIILSPGYTYGKSDIKSHTLKFYFNSNLTIDINFAKTVLPKYVEDMNIILAKNTNREFIFNPETDIVIVNSKPYTDYDPSILPTENFEIWTYVMSSQYSYSYGGYASVDISGTGVLAGLYWTRLYDPDNLTSSELIDYWTQINNMLHELAHIFGAGIGEYYNLSKIYDTTNVPPILNINVYDSNDQFWNDKRDFMSDPLLRNVASIYPTRLSLLDYVKYSNLTATIISGNYRNSVPMVNLENIIIKVVDNNKVPIDAANIKIWSVVGNAPYQTQLMVDVLTDSNGQASFAWGGSINPHNNYDFLRLIKIYKDGYFDSAKYVSIYDTDIEKLINNKDSFSILISLNTIKVFIPVIMKG